MVREDPRRQRWEDVADWPLTIAALLFLGAYAWPILDPGLPRPWPAVCNGVAWATWGIFGIDYFGRLVVSRQRAVFVRRNVVDLLVVVLPLLRPLRLVRLVTLLSVLNRYAGGSLRGRVAVYVAAATSLILFVAALAVLDAERGAAGANLTSFGEALWWSMTTVTTVGYGDHYPVTTTGRFVAGGLMLAGIALLGVVTASFASWLIDRVKQVEEDSRAVTRADMAALAAEVSALRAQLATEPSAPNTPRPGQLTSGPALPGG